MFPMSNGAIVPKVYTENIVAMFYPHWPVHMSLVLGEEEIS